MPFVFFVPYHSLYLLDCVGQVFAVSAELLDQVLSRLVDLLADEFYRLLSAVKTFTSAGVVTVSH